MNWDRVQRLEMELAMVRAVLVERTAERDRARDLACRLEAELAQVTA